MGIRHQFACGSLVVLFSILLLVTTNSFVRMQAAKATTALSSLQKPVIQR